MKRIVSILLAALLACLCAGSVAEGDAQPGNAADSFCDVWISEADDISAALEIWLEDGAFYCSGNRALDDEGNVDYRWEYDDCRYDAANNCLVCTGTRTHNVFDDASLTLSTDESVTGVTATFSVDGEGKLLWQDSEGIMDGVAFLRLDLAEMLGEDYTPDPNSLAFEGTWVCGRASIVISAEDEGFKCSITWPGSAAEVAQWEYACMYDAENNTLRDMGMGVKSVLEYGEGGEVESVAEEYSDGRATFSLDDRDVLTWHDEVEDAGLDMAFERVDSYVSEGGFEMGDDARGFIGDEGHYIIQIPVAEGDTGEWRADDMSQDDSVVKLYYADTLEGTFIANYAPTGDGTATVSVRHFDGIACDEVYAWDLAVENGAVSKSLGGSWLTSPDEADLEAMFSGEWTESGSGLAAMTVSKDPDGGWCAEIAVGGTEGASLFRLNLYYDCELDAFVYADGQVYETAVTDGTEAAAETLLRGDATGSLRSVADGRRDMLEWYSDLSPETTLRFVRAAD